MARRRKFSLPALIAAAVTVACAVALSAVTEKAEATFPDKNVRIAYQGSDGVIYTTSPDAGGKTKVTNNNMEGFNPSFLTDGKKIAYSAWDGNDQEIYTVKAPGGNPFKYAYSARDAPSESSQGFQPSGGKGPAYNASEKLQLTKTEAGARVTLNWVYAEENYVSIGYQVEDLKVDRRVAGHPAELQPLLGFGYGKPTPREREYFKKYNLGTDIVALTDERPTKFRMVDNSMESSAGPKPVEGPLENLVAFKPKEALKPSKDHDFRLQIPLYESAVVPLEGKQPPPEPFPGDPFVFNFDVPVHAVSVVDVNQKATAKGVTLTLDRVINSPGRPRAVICYEPPDDKHSWLSYGGEGTFQGGWSTSGWSATGSMRSIPPAKCQKLMLKAPAERRMSVEVRMLEGWPDCESFKEETAWQACMKKRYRTIPGPWRFEFEGQDPAGGARPEREADD